MDQKISKSENLKSLNIKICDFQSIDSLDIEVYGFTCITGKSNIGKSAIVRAITSSLLNTPTVGMVRKGKVFSSVQVQSLDWGYKWEKGERGINRYTIDSQVLDKTGQTQIDQIAKMGFFPIKIGKDRKINPWCASQFDPIFLLNETGATVTDFISEVSNLQVLQDSVVLSSRGRKKLLDQVKQKTEEIDRYEIKLVKVRELDSLEKISIELFQQASSIEGYEINIDKAEEFISQIQSCERFIRIFDQISKVKIPNSQIIDITRLKDANDWRQKLVAAAQRIISLKGSSKNQIPEVPEFDLSDFTRFEKINRFKHVPGLVKSVDQLSAISKIPVLDDSVKINMDSYQKLFLLYEKIDSAAKSIEPFNLKVKIPESIDEFEKFSNMFALSQELDKTSHSIVKLNRESQELERLLAIVENEISMIPNCPTCGRVGQVRNHTHKETKLAGPESVD